MLGEQMSGEPGVLTPGFAQRVSGGRGRTLWEAPAVHQRDRRLK